jgi:DNA-directed RNA polymerase subunit E'/Rpb7
MARIIRLTERDLTRLVKRVINEESNRYFKIGDMIKLKVGTNNTNTIVAKITNSESNEPGNTTYYFKVSKVFNTNKYKVDSTGHFEYYGIYGYTIYFNDGTQMDGKDSDIVKL